MKRNSKKKKIQKMEKNNTIEKKGIKPIECKRAY